MSEITYSTKALSVLKRFLRVDVVVHVESNDDSIFWEKVFELVTDAKIGFVPVGGCAELDRRINLIEDGSLDALAARDSDYKVLRRISSTNPRVLYSYGHSIENSLFSITSVAYIAKLASRTNDDLLPHAVRWQTLFCETFGSLLKFDLANEIAGSGVAVLGDNCSRYMENNSSEVPCFEKVSAKNAAMVNEINEESILLAENILNENFDAWRWLRGHFIASGVQKFISNTAKSLGKKTSVAHDHLFEQAIMCLTNVFTKEPRQKEYYQQSISSALLTF